MGNALEITDANFKQYADGDKLFVVDFWAQWCGPCLAMAPVIEELATELGENVVIGKMDVDNNSEVPVTYGIMNIPTLLFFRGGQVIDKQVGATGKASLLRKIEQHMVA